MFIVQYAHASSLNLCRHIGPLLMASFVCEDFQPAGGVVHFSVTYELLV